jgi:hypothetical protein
MGSVDDRPETETETERGAAHLVDDRDDARRASVERKARWAYERARLRSAALGVLPLIALVGVAVWFARRPLSSLGFGAIAVVAGLVMLFYGRDPQRAVLPGVAAGSIPLILATCANRLHCCGPEGCGMWCVPACAAGGVVAGLVIARIGVVKRAGPFFWVSASGLALLTGAMGCSCVGYSGVVGLGLGFSFGVVPGVLRRAYLAFAR